MKELVIISGKGGTGKTSLTACFAVLSDNAVFADCDVDAADLHLILEPRVKRREDFSGGRRARILTGHCIACAKCEEICRFDAVFFDGPGNGRYEKTFRIDPIACEGCGVCARFCAENAIEFKEVVNGKWFISETRRGPMVHAELGPGEENSGKLVTLVRNEAKKIAESDDRDLVIIDGSPGIGCPVIASVTGADMAVAVTEPTLSGLHDLGRVFDLTNHFNIKTMACINKWDLNREMTQKIVRFCEEHGIEIAGKIRYDAELTKAQIAKKSMVEYNKQAGSSQDIISVWNSIGERLDL